MNQISLTKFEQHLTHIKPSDKVYNDFDNIVLMRLFHHIEPRITHFLNQSLQEYGLQHHAWFALLAIYSENDHRILPSQLSACLDLTRTSITRLSNELVDRGLIRRINNEQDHRQTILMLTETGLQLIQEINIGTQQARLDLLSGFSDEEKTQFEEYLRRLLNSLNTFSAF